MKGSTSFNDPFCFLFYTRKQIVVPVTSNHLGETTRSNCIDLRSMHDSYRSFRVETSHITSVTDHPLV